MKKALGSKLKSGSTIITDLAKPFKTLLELDQVDHKRVHFKMSFFLLLHQRCVRVATQEPDSAKQ